MASESGEAGGLSEYIRHHLQHLANKHQEGLFDFSVIHLDTLFFSLLCAAIILIVLRLAARKATPGVPGKFQAAVEMLVEMVNEQANAARSPSRRGSRQPPGTSPDTRRRLARGEVQHDQHQSRRRGGGKKTACSRWITEGSNKPSWCLLARCCRWWWMYKYKPRRLPPDSLAVQNSRSPERTEQKCCLFCQLFRGIVAGVQMDRPWCPPGEK